MSKMIFVNLPVTDVETSVAFYEAIGFTKDVRFSQPGTTAAMVWSDAIVIMLLSHARFADFTSKRIIDAHKDVQALLCLSIDGRDGVDAIVGKAVAAGGKADPCPKQDFGFMYGRSFEDLDGHVYEPMWMDLDAAMAAMGSQSETPA
ncbi:MAG: VOC family protein [Bosea sp. (in: a-proteobacteria)]